MAQHFPQTPLKRSRSATTLRLRVLMDEQQRVEIGGRIRDLRESSPETNRSIGDYVGVGERSVANWISGDTGITYEHAKKVAELFEVDVRWLWDGKERGEAPDPFANPQLDAIEKKLDKLLAAIGQPDFEGIEQAAAAAAQESAPAPRRASQASGTKPRKRAAS